MEVDDEEDWAERKKKKKEGRGEGKRGIVIGGKILRDDEEDRTLSARRNL